MIFLHFTASPLYLSVLFVNTCASVDTRDYLKKLTDSLACLCFCVAPEIASSHLPIQTEPPRLCRSRPPQPATNFLSCDGRQSSHPPVTAVRRRRLRPPLLPPPRPPRAPSNVGIGESTTAVLPALHEIMTHQQQISERQAIGSAYVSKAEREVFQVCIILIN